MIEREDELLLQVDDLASAPCDRQSPQDRDFLLLVDVMRIEVKQLEENLTKILSLNFAQLYIFIADIRRA